MFRHFNRSKKVANVIWLTVGVLPVWGFYDFSLEFDIQNDNVFLDGQWSWKNSKQKLALI